MVARPVTLLSATFLGLACGTLYLFLLYLPQFAARLGYSAQEALLIGLTGQIGVACAGPAAGLLVDRHGWYVPITIGVMLIAGGYTGMRLQYDSGWASCGASRTLLFMVGCGSTFVLSLVLNCCAVLFPQMRGVATSLPLLMTGLSASVFLFVASHYYPGDTSGMLGFLVAAVVGLYIVCTPAVVMAKREVRKMGTTEVADSGCTLPAILSTSQFWLLVGSLGLFAGLGQMYIFLAGYVVLALSGGHNNAQSQQEQQFQVAVLSIANCAGRLVSGVVGDAAVAYRQPRAALLLLPASACVFTQWMGTWLGLQELPFQLALTGGAYGFTYCLYPLLVGDAFGMKHFSLNWGTVGLAPMLPAYLLNRVFGQEYDRSVVDVAGVRVCEAGRACYERAFWTGLFWAVVGAAMAGALVFAAYRTLLRRGGSPSRSG